MNKLLMEENNRPQKQVSRLVYENGQSCESGHMWSALPTTKRSMSASSKGAAVDWVLIATHQLSWFLVLLMESSKFWMHLKMWSTRGQELKYHELFRKKLEN